MNPSAALAFVLKFGSRFHRRQSYCTPAQPAPERISQTPGSEIGEWPERW